VRLNLDAVVDHGCLQRHGGGQGCQLRATWSYGGVRYAPAGWVSIDGGEVVLILAVTLGEARMMYWVQWRGRDLSKYCRVSINSSVTCHGGYLTCRNLTLVTGHGEVLMKGPNVTLDHMWYFWLL